MFPPAGNIELNHGHITRPDIVPRHKKTPNYRMNVVSINRSEYRLQEPNRNHDGSLRVMWPLYSDNRII